MKKIIAIISALICFTVMADAQSRALGARLGGCGIELSYTYDLSHTTFAEFNLGMDVGYDNSPGFKVTGIYNYILARPSFTTRGNWTLYGGPGVSAGYVEDKIKGNEHYTMYEHGFMAAIVGQIGLDYTFWFPLQLALDMRPAFGFHVNGGGDGYDAKVGVYDNGFRGFMPTLSIRYKF